MKLKTHFSLSLIFIFYTNQVNANAPTEISDEIWQEVAGDKIQETYEIQPGDTLSLISKRLFGDLKYWPKIWSINNKKIVNPNLIYPKNIIAFNPGSENELPTVDVQSSGEKAVDQVQADDSIDSYSPAPTGPSGLLDSKGRSREWMKLGRQTWEFVQAALPPSIDADGFDRKSRTGFYSGKNRIELKYFLNPDKLDYLGEVIGSRTDGSSLTLGDPIYIEATNELEIGKTYALTTTPQKFYSDKPSRKTYAYPITGKIKIEGTKDDLYFGTITSSSDTTERSFYLINDPAAVELKEVTSGPEPLRATLTLDKTSMTSTAAQFDEVFVGLGVEDGIKPGMVFRAYQYRDPFNDSKITNADFIILGDILVVSVTEEFSTGIVLSSVMPLKENTKLVLLTDIVDVKRNKGFREKTVEGETTTTNDEEDELDRLDRENKDNLNKKEKKELEELEDIDEDFDPSQDAETKTKTTEESDALEESLEESTPTESAKESSSSPTESDDLDSLPELDDLPPAPSSP